MEIVRELHGKRGLRRRAHSPGIRVSREHEELRLQAVAVKTAQLVLQAHQTFDVLIVRLSGVGHESLVRVHGARNPQKLILIGANPIPAVAASQRAAQVQALLRPVKKVSQGYQERILVQVTLPESLNFREFCFGALRLPAKRRSKRGPCGPRSRAVRGTRIRTQRRLTVAAGEVVTEINRAGELPPEIRLL